MRTAPAGKTPAVNATDISRASAQGVTVSAPSTTEGNAVAGDLPTSNVDGSDIRSLVIPKAQAWSRVRKIRYQLTGNVSPAGSTYDKYAYVTSPVPSSSVPGSGNAIYDILDAGEDVDQSDFTGLINSLKTMINSDNLIQQHLITYCHSQCHSQCHGSRGRR